MNRTFRFKQIVNTYDSTMDGRISPVAVLEYFQEAAQRNIEELGIGLDYLYENHYAWILVKYEIDFNAYPKGGEEVTVETEPVGINRFEAYRRFRLVSETGEELVTGKSVWMLLNIATGRLVRISSVKEMERLTQGENQIYRIPNLKPVETYETEEKYKVRFTDIDINLHANNVQYLVWALESLPWEVLREYEIKSLRIVYKEQSFYKEIVHAKTAKVGENTWRSDIYNGQGKLLCQIEMIGREREEKLSTKR